MIQNFFAYLLDLFKLCGAALITWLLFLGLRDRFFRSLTIAILVISIFGSLYTSIYISTHKASKYVNEKTEGINKSIDNVGKSIDKFSEAVKGVSDTVYKVENSPIVESTKKATNKINEIDNKIKDKGFEIREKITGQKTNRLEE